MCHSLKTWRSAFYHSSNNIQLEDNAAFMDKYSRQIGAFGLEAMSKLMNLKVLIVGLRYVVMVRCTAAIDPVSS